MGLVYKVVCFCDSLRVIEGLNMYLHLIKIYINEGYVQYGTPPHDVPPHILTPVSVRLKG